MYVIYCSEQLDGISAAAIIFRYARLKNISCKIGGFLNYREIDKTFEEMSQLKKSLIFILDFSPEQITNLDEKLKKVTLNNRIVYWNCHHPYDDEIMTLMMKYVHSLEFSGSLKSGKKKELRLCSADLVCNKFLPNDRVAQNLKILAHDIEFWERKNENALKLADIITLGRDKKELINTLSRGVFWSTNLEKARNDYLTKKEKACNDLMKRIVIRKYVDLRFGFSLSSSILSTADAGTKILEDHDSVDVSVVLYRNGKISFRRRDDCNINLLKLAKSFDGGGHEYASGGSLNEFKTVSLENFERILFLLDRKIKTFFSI